MANQWFKFYGGEYLSDPKMLALTSSERSCFLTLLCYASMTGKEGVVSYITEETLMAQSGISFMQEEWERTKGVMKKLEKLKIITIDNDNITIKNWRKRQEMALTGYERVKRHREKMRGDNADNESANTRVDKNRRRIDIDERVHPERSPKYLVDIPGDDMAIFKERFSATERDIKSKAEDLRLYCERKGKVYKDYRAFLVNALKRDFGERADAGGKYKGL